MNNNFDQKLTLLYGGEKGLEVAKKLERFVKDTKSEIKHKKIPLWDEKDIALIIYPDSFQESGTPSLKTLNKFLTSFVKDKFSIIHILPFYPFSADRGFSVIDYFKVKKEFGSWLDIAPIAKKYRLMADLVANHTSKSHIWFQKFLQGNNKYEDYFLSFRKDNLPSDEQISMVRRGRATALLNQFKTKNGIRYLWSTYSIGSLIDQMDLNYHNPEVLLEMVKIFLFYLKKGVNILRFDGAGSLWKELGTSCKHLPQNHVIVSLFRSIIDEVSPGSLIFTETTTASFEENISYLNNEEAHVVYNFTLAPLVLHAFYTSSAKLLTNFTNKLNPSSTKNTFFNILDVHDGINVYSVSKEIPGKELEVILNGVKSRGGEFSYRNLPDGGKAVKEMHITWWSALNKDGEESFDLQLRKFVTSRAIAMSLKGIPSIYYLSLFGAKNDITAFQKTNHGRDMNRTNFSYKDISQRLNDKKSRESKIFYALTQLLEKRKGFKAFHPNAYQKVLSLDPHVFAILRGEGENKLLALHNVSNKQIKITYNRKSYALEPYSFLWEPL